MGEIMLGTSGWSYEEWVEPFYRFKKVSKLGFYNRVFKTAEIDSTFYRYPNEGMVFGWLRYTDPGFVFTAKLPQVITHEKMLDLDQGVEDDLAKFCDLMRRLLDAGKLGCLLIQLPPKFTVDQIGDLERFFEILPREFPFAVEFRDLSWINNETWKLLSKYNVAYTNVDEPLLPPEVKVTSDFAYFRWHGRGRRPWFDYRYKEDELKPWVPRVKETANKLKKVYGYFNNHYHGYAVENCLQVLEMLGVLTPEQADAKAHIQAYLAKTPRRGKPEVKVDALDQWMGQGREDMLEELAGAERLKRARKIKEEEIKVEEATYSIVRATVKDYHVVVDGNNKVILHDCADWDRLIPEKKICKHIAKLILSIDEDLAVRILRAIRSEMDSWDFRPYVDSTGH